MMDAHPLCWILGEGGDLLKLMLDYCGHLLVSGGVCKVVVHTC